MAPRPDDPTQAPDSDFPLPQVTVPADPTFLADSPLPPAGDADPEFFTPDTLLPEDGPTPLDRRRAAELVPGYEILQELGRGGMGIVYKAKQLGLKRVVALKMILAGAHAGPEERARFLQEAEAIARLAHPNIVGVYEVSQHAGQPYFSLEFCPGGSLAEHLTGTPLPPRLAARLTLPLARAVQHAHDHGIVHRDLKPGNILLSLQDGENRTQIEKAAKGDSGQAAFFILYSAIPKVTDFGLAKRLDGDSRTRDGDVMGTPSYMAPEQAAGKVHQIGPHSDTYALGAILYELLTGRPPFVASSPMETVFQVITRDPVPVRALQPKTPRDLETVALKCLQKEPHKRYASAAALADDLQRYLDGQPILARPVGPLESAWRWTRRHPAQAALVAVLMLAGAGGVAGWAWFTQQLRVEKRLANDKAAEAEEARGQAVSSQREAEASERLAKDNEVLAEARFLKMLEVADRYFTEVSESTLLHEPGMQPLRERLLSQARDFYAGFVRDRPNDPRLEGELARSVYRLGGIDAELARYDDAVAHFADARARFDRLLQGRSADGRLRETRARLLNDLGRSHLRRSRYDEATAAYRDALVAWERFDRDTSGSRAAREGLGHCLLGLGNVGLKQGRRDEALGHYQRSLALRRELVSADPDNEGYRRELGVTWQNQAALLTDMGRKADAAEARRQALATFRQLVTAYPSRGRYQEDLGRECYNEGHLLMMRKEFEPAAGHYAEAVGCFEHLVAAHPAVPHYRNRLGDALWNRALCLDELKSATVAEAEYGKAREVRRQLAASQPAVPGYQEAYVQCLRRDGDRADARGNKKAAAEAFRQGRQWLEKSPPSPEGRLLLAVLLLRSAEVAEDGPKAARFLDQALMEVRALARQRQVVERAAKVERLILRERAKGAAGGR
ncbi:MAG: serine/threonine-protein kinase [Gemmataceae bacterium]